MRKKVFVSFDYERDRNYRYLLTAWDRNENFEFTFDDRTPGEIQSDSVDVVKNVLSRKINESSCVLVIVGQDINKRHRDAYKINYINWQNYEIAKAKELGKSILVVKLNPCYPTPNELNRWHFKCITRFDQAEIVKALR